MTFPFSRKDGVALYDALVVLWEWAYSSLDVLEHDLDACRRYFNPVLTGRTVRERLGALPPPPPIESIPMSPMTFDCGDGKLLPSPEGRAALELLGTVLDGTHDPVERNLELELPLVERVLAVYSDVSRHRLQQVIDLQEGVEPLRIPSIGVVLVLLINRSTSPERALVRHETGRAKGTIDRAFYAAVDAFASRVAPSRRRATAKESLIKGWTLHEAVRRMPHAIILQDEDVDESREDSGEVASGSGQRRVRKVYVDATLEDRVIDVLGRELADRGKIRPDVLEEALDDLIGEFRQHLSELAIYGLAYERPHETERTRRRVLAAYQVARDQRQL